MCYNGTILREDGAIIMVVDTHGYKMRGLKQVAGETKCLRGYYSGVYLELFYDVCSGEVWTVYQFSYGHNSWTVYKSCSVIKICDLTSPKSMQDIADLICEDLSRCNYVS